MSRALCWTGMWIWAWGCKPCCFSLSCCALVSYKSSASVLALSSSKMPLFTTFQAKLERVLHKILQEAKLLRKTGWSWQPCWSYHSSVVLCPAVWAANAVSYPQLPCEDLVPWQGEVQSSWCCIWQSKSEYVGGNAVPLAPICHAVGGQNECKL